MLLVRLDGLSICNLLRICTNMFLYTGVVYVLYGPTHNFADSCLAHLSKLKELNQVAWENECIYLRELFYQSQDPNH